MPVGVGDSSMTDPTAMDSRDRTAEGNIATYAQSDGSLRYKANPESIPKDSDLYLSKNCIAHYPYDVLVTDFDNYGNYTKDYYDRLCPGDKTKSELIKSYK